MKRSSGSAFSLVELIVVVAIIGVLTTLGIVSFRGIRQNARDSRRIADINQLQLALKTYYNDNGFYPTYITPGTSLVYGGKTYLQQIPANPEPKNDKDCPDADYVYAPLENGQSYSLNFCLASKTSSLAGGVYTATSLGLLSCPEGYVRVVGSADMNTPDFCVMKYEAKCNNKDPKFTGVGAYDNVSEPCEGVHSVVSQSDGMPIGNVTVTQARAYCHALGAHLMTNAEWMTIARAGEMNPSNWSDEIWYSTLARGNFDGGSVMDGAWEYADGENSTDLAHRRTLELPSGEKIWDISGNVAEWVDDTCEQGESAGRYYDTSGNPVNWHDNNLLDYELGVSGPIDESPDEQQYGSYKGCSADDYSIARGGALNDVGVDDPAHGAGIYYMNMTAGIEEPLEATGFRCVK